MLLAQVAVYLPAVWQDVQLREESRGGRDSLPDAGHLPIPLGARHVGVRPKQVADPAFAGRRYTNGPPHRERAGGELGRRPAGRSRWPCAVPEAGWRAPSGTPI